MITNWVRIKPAFCNHQHRCIAFLCTLNHDAPLYELEIVAVVVHTAHTSHSAHSTHAPHAAHSAAHAARHPAHWPRCFLMPFGDSRLGRVHPARGAGRILEL